MSRANETRIAVQYIPRGGNRAGAAMGDRYSTIEEIRRGYWQDPAGRQYEFVGSAYERARQAQTPEEVSAISQSSRAEYEQKTQQVQAELHQKREALRQGYSGTFRDEYNQRMAASPVGTPVPTRQEYAQVKYMQSPTGQYASEESFRASAAKVERFAPFAGVKEFRGQIVQPAPQPPPQAAADVSPFGKNMLRRENFAGYKPFELPNQPTLESLRWAKRTKYDPVTERLMSTQSSKTAGVALDWIGGAQKEIERATSNRSYFTNFNAGVVTGGLEATKMLVGAGRFLGNVFEAPGATTERFKQQVPGAAAIAANVLPSLGKQAFKNPAKASGELVGMSLLFGAGKKGTETTLYNTGRWFSEDYRAVGVKRFIRSESATAPYDIRAEMSKAAREGRLKPAETDITPFQREQTPYDLQPLPMRAVKTKVATLGREQYLPTKSEYLMESLGKLRYQENPKVLPGLRNLRTAPKPITKPLTIPLVAVNVQSLTRTQTQTRTRSKTLPILALDVREAVNTRTLARVKTLAFPKVRIQEQTKVGIQAQTRLITKPALGLKPFTQTETYSSVKGIQSFATSMQKSLAKQSRGTMVQDAFKITIPKLGFGFGEGRKKGKKKNVFAWDIKNFHIGIGDL